MEISLDRHFRELQGSYVVDPRNFVDYRDFTIDTYIDLPPGDFLLARSVEKVHIPEGSLGILFPKSTFLRCGLVFGSGFVRPGWNDHLVLELGNLNSYRPIRIHIGDAIASVELVAPFGLLETYTGRYKGDNPLGPKPTIPVMVEEPCIMCGAVIHYACGLRSIICPNCEAVNQL